MKNTPWRSVIFIFIISILLSCAPYSVRYYEKPIGKMEEITLISTMIGKPELSPLPLLDAPFFNAKVRSKANEIIELQKKVIDQYRETVASNLEKNCVLK
ncbi:MAG: hypothetical protein NZ845_01525 [Thermodesulfovibrio sp.]|nr:hypothetical protein [Thermodesulfovibrio sp.]MDW7972449.1 hypothetical protein [Thermodesulfovibrio sp.]